MIVYSSDIDLHTHETALQLALGLERKFPKNNSPLAYGTRLCEEIGELVEATEMLENSRTAKTQEHFIKEVKDVLQIVFGVLHCYEILPRSVPEMAAPSTNVVVLAGQFANAINHAEGQGVKAAKHGEAWSGRLIESAAQLVAALDAMLERFDTQADFQALLASDYTYMKTRGYIQ